MELNTLKAYLIAENRGTPTPSILVLIFNDILGAETPLSDGEIKKLYANSSEMPPTESMHRLRLHRGKAKPLSDKQSGCRIEWLASLLVVGQGRRGGHPCRVFYPELLPAVTAILFHRDETFPSPADAATTLWIRLLDQDGWLKQSFELFEALARMEATTGLVHFQVGIEPRRWIFCLAECRSSQFARNLACEVVGLPCRTGRHWAPARWAASGFGQLRKGTAGQARGQGGIRGQGEHGYLYGTAISVHVRAGGGGVREGQLRGIRHAVVRST